MTKKSTGLGRGFDTLIPQNFDSSLLLDEHERVQKLFTDDIQPNPEQPRKSFDKQALDELASSIKRHGVLQPVVVTVLKDGKYALVAGERRWRAATLAGLKSIPAIVRTTQQLEQLEIALVENVQRVDLSPLEQAVSIQRLHDQFNISYEDIAKRLGKGLSTITNMVRLLQLPPAASEALRNGQITEGHARAILAIKDDPKKQAELLTLIQKHRWSVRQAEQFVTAYKGGHKTTAAAQERTKTTTPGTRLLSQALGVPVSVRRTAKGGKLELAFTSEDDLDQLIELLSKLALGSKKS